MSQPLVDRFVSTRTPMEQTTDRWAAALLGGAALGGATLLACAIQGWGAGLLPAGALRLASALAFGLVLAPVLAAGGRLFGRSCNEDDRPTELIDGLGDLLGNACGALLVAVPAGLLLRMAFAGGGLEATLATLAEARSDPPFESLLLRATLCGALMAIGLENWRAGERLIDRLGGFLLAILPMVLLGFSLVAVDLLVLPMTLLMEGSIHSAQWIPSLFPVMWGNLMGAAMVAAFFGRRDQPRAAAAS
ncbi:MAG: formate/nitrite transporter family protein [Acidobacteriota bacterium]